LLNSSPKVDEPPKSLAKEKIQLKEISPTEVAE
jgi:hypothetical protein